MPNRLARTVLGPQNAPTILLTGSPSIFWPLMLQAVLRVMYAVEAIAHGSPQALAAGGAAYSLAYSLGFAFASVWAMVGTVISLGTGRTRQEFVGNVLVLGGYATLVGLVLWNTWHSLPQQGLVPVWPTVALAVLPAWRLLNMAAAYRPMPGKQPLRWKRKGTPE